MSEPKIEFTQEELKQFLLEAQTDFVINSLGKINAQHTANYLDTYAKNLEISNIKSTFSGYEEVVRKILNGIANDLKFRAQMMRDAYEE